MTAYIDTFVRDNLPEKEHWPDFANLDRFDYPEHLNCAKPLLDDAVEEGCGNRTAVIMPGCQWSYAELQADANRMARVLVEDLGVIPGNRVLLRGPNSYGMLAAWFAVMKAGAIAVSTMPLLRAKELQTIVNKAKVRLALCDSRLQEEMESSHEESCLERIVTFHDGELEKLQEKKQDGFENVETLQDDPCLIAFTSGTTGEPKAAVHFHRDMLSMCRAYSENCLSPVPEDRFIGSPPLAFTFGLGGIGLFPLHARASTVLLEQATPDKLFPAIKEHQATVLFTSPTAYRFMLNKIETDMPASLRVCVSAGEMLPKPTFDAWKEKTGLEILDGIGSTELLHIFISSNKDSLRPGSTGKPVPGYEAKVVDDDMSTVEPGTSGHLAVRGPTGCTYLADERQREYVRDGWNLTGDTYMIDAEGFFWFQARTDDMIISGGYNIAGPEVEAALFAHYAVAECAVIGVPDERRGQLVKAFVVLKGEHKAQENLTAELQDFVKNTIAPYKYPRAIEFVASLPKTETGKIQRFRLRERGVSG